MQTITNCLCDSIACKQANKSSGKVRIFGCIIIVSLTHLTLTRPRPLKGGTPRIQCHHHHLLPTSFRRHSKVCGGGGGGGGGGGKVEPYITHQGAGYGNKDIYHS